MDRKTIALILTSVCALFMTSMAIFKELEIEKIKSSSNYSKLHFRLLCAIRSFLFCEQGEIVILSKIFGYVLFFLFN